MAAEALLYAFDLLFLDGHDLREWALSDRRYALLGTIGEYHPVLRFSQDWETTGAELFAAAEANDLEEIVSKRRDLPYTSGRREEWLKTKRVQDGTFVVVGYQSRLRAARRLGPSTSSPKRRVDCDMSVPSARAFRSRRRRSCGTRSRTESDFR